MPALNQMGGWGSVITWRCAGFPSQPPLAETFSLQHTLLQGPESRGHDRSRPGIHSRKCLVVRMFLVSDAGCQLSYTVTYVMTNIVRNIELLSSDIKNEEFILSCSYQTIMRDPELLPNTLIMLDCAVFLGFCVAVGGHRADTSCLSQKYSTQCRFMPLLRSTRVAIAMNS